MLAHLVISCAHNPSEQHEAIEQSLAETAALAGCPVLMVPHLYHLPGDSALWQRLAALPSPVVWASWLEARALEALLASRGIPAPACCLALKTDADPAQLAAQAPDLTGRGDAPATCEALDEATADRWYPIIDRTRCTRCGQCFQFCLFGVYERDPDGTVQVAQPDSCKAGCPACSRVCPESAIMFPLFTQDPAICGAPGCFVTRDPDSAEHVRRRLQTTLKVSQTPVLDEIDALITELDELAGGIAP